MLVDLLVCQTLVLIDMKNENEFVLLATLITSYLAQIHITLLEIMGRVGSGSATIETYNQK